MSYARLTIMIARRCDSTSSLYEQARKKGRKDTKLAQKSGQLQPFTSVLYSHRKAWASLHLLGRPNPSPRLLEYPALFLRFYAVASLAYGGIAVHTCMTGIPSQNRNWPTCEIRANPADASLQSDEIDEMAIILTCTAHSKALIVSGTGYNDVCLVAERRDPLRVRPPRD
jgi:hypothetical protein